MRDHILNVGPGGALREDGQYSTTTADLDRIVAAITVNPTVPLVLHFHGGLVNQTAGLAIARAMTDLYLGKAYPVTVVWSTGALETLAANLDRVWTTRLFQKLARLGLKYVGKRLGFAADGSKSAAGGTMTDAEIDALMLDADLAQRRDAGARGQPLAISAADLPTIELELTAEIEAEVDTDREAVLQAMAEDGRLVADTPLGSRGPGLLLGKAVTFAVRIAVATLRRFVAGRDHGLHATVIEEILRAAWLADLGTWGWTAMKQTAEQMWLPPHAAHLAGGSLLLDRLVAHGNLPPIDVVGHSAGSIAICHMVVALMQRYPGVALRNVTFLAPACRHDLFAATLVPALAAKRIRSLRMFTMSDEHERRDALVDKAPFLYPRSLLYLVSGIFEDVADTPLLGMQRFLSGVTPFIGAEYDHVHAALADAGLGWSPTAAAAPLGMRCTAVDHGTFDEDPRLRESLVEIVRA